jgi:repressor LexA
MAYRLKEIRKKHGETQKDLATFLKITPQMVSKYETGLSEMSNEIEEKIANHYNVTIDQLRGIDRPTPNRIPVYTSIQAGIPLNSITDIDGWEEIDGSMQGTFFALRVRGHSMEPEIKDGDVVICRVQSTVENGQIAVVLVNGDEATLKQFKRTDKGVTLIGFNVDVYPPHFYTAEEVNSLPVRVVARAVETRHKL